MPTYRGFSYSALATAMMASTATTSEVSTATATATTEADIDGSHAVFLYPTGRPTVNNIDTVQVTYDTVWEHANLTIYCETNDDLDTWAVAAINMIDPNGTYAIAPIQAGMDIPQFPVYCHLMLEDAKDAADNLHGGGFTMVSTEGVVSTYALQATVAAIATTTGTSSSDASDSGSGTEYGTGSRTGSASVGDGGSASSATGSSAAQTAIASSSSGGLSGGAKAGIAVGVIIGVIAILAAIFFFFRTRRLGERLESTVQTSNAEKAAAAATAQPAGATAAESGGTPASQRQARNRNSEDWRRFFGNAINPSRPQTGT